MSQRILLLSAAILAAVIGAWVFQHSAVPTAVEKITYATDLNGNPVELAPQLSKPLLINFWASWCQPCVKELPLLEKYAAANAQDVEVLAVAVDTIPHINDFLKKHPLNLDIAVAKATINDLMSQWGNDKSALPYSVLLDTDGKLIKSHLGPFDEASLADFVQTGS